MRKIALLGASALILTAVVAGASAEPFNPVTNSYGTIKAPIHGYGRLREGRAAAIDVPVPYFGIPTPFVGPNARPSTPASIVLQQYHEGK